MTTPTEPTPTPGDVREVVADWLYRNAGSRYSWDSSFANVSERIRDTYRERAEQLIAALHDAGFTIIRPEAGTVTIPLDVAHELNRELIATAIAGRVGTPGYQAWQMLGSAIAAAAPDTEPDQETK